MGADEETEGIAVTNQDTYKGEAAPHTPHIPYVAGLSEDQGGIEPNKDRDPALKISGVVYEIPCSCGQKYIGEMKRAQDTCWEEHQAYTRRESMLGPNTSSHPGRRQGSSTMQAATSHR